MFKIIRKWYFKIYHLFKLLGIFILIFGIKENVKALTPEEYKSSYQISESSCTENLMNQNFVKNSRYNTNTNVLGSLNNGYTSYLIPVKPNTTYYISYDNTVSSASVYYSNTGNYTTNTVKSLNYRVGGKFTTESTTKYIGLYIYQPKNEDINIMMNEGETAKEYTEFKTVCEDTPEPSDNVYSNFLNLYTEKLEYLASGFTNNPYLLAMIGIIFSFIILEITLKLFHMKGGK